MSPLATAYSGQLNASSAVRDLSAGLFRMVISQETADTNVATSTLAGLLMREGSRFGDTMLFNWTDIAHSWDFKKKPVNILDSNFLPNNQVPSVINVARQTFVTIERFFSSQAFQDEGSWAQLIGVMSNSVTETKRAYDQYVDTYVGNYKPPTEQIMDVDISDLNLTPTTNAERSEMYRLIGGRVKQTVMDLISDASTNDRNNTPSKRYTHIPKENLITVYSSRILNLIENLSIPTIYHEQKLKPELNRELNTKFWGGGPNAAAATTAAGQRAYIELDAKDYPGLDKEYFPAELVTAGQSVPAGTVYTPATGKITDGEPVMALFDVRAIPVRTSIELGDSFANPAVQEDNLYYFWMHNTLVTLPQFAFFLIRLKTT